MPFPLIAAGLKFGIPAALSLLSGGGGKKGQKAQRSLPEVLKPGELGQEQTAFGQLGNFDVDLMNSPFFKQFMERSNQAGGAATDFWTQLLEGDPTTQAQFLAPEIEGIQRSYQSGLDQVERFGPRGGERDRALTMSRMGKAGDIARLKSTTRPAAASQLGQLSQSQGQLGLGAGQLGLGEAGLEMESLVRLLQMLGQKRGQRLGFLGGKETRDQRTAEGFGEGLGGIAQVLFEQIFNQDGKKKGGGGRGGGGGGGGGPDVDFKY